ncbi:MAG: hypothetical protein DMG79_08495 [Acidobacteria bacterium]|nr:MAG: hypothetical protein DMG79_08495 [Acidobacteriota bacterium]
MGRARAKLLVWGTFSCALSLAALGQEVPKSAARHSAETVARQNSESNSPQLLTADEGLAIIGAALETRQSSHTTGDCSHVVHAIYKLAGFPYSYADSSHLYDGVDDFRRVSHPQPGDLAVWRGHAAIVVNPAQHSFFSSTRSGLRVESYELEYWKRQGPPRFFRYVKTALSSSPLLTRTASAPARSTALRTAGSRMPPPAEIDFESLSENDASQDDVKADAAAPASQTFNQASRILVHARQPEPKQLNDALSQYFAEAETALRSQDVLSPSEPLIVFDRVEIKGVHLKGQQCWVEIKFTGVSSLQPGRAAKKKSSEQQRWILVHRDADGWELLAPPKTTYIPHDVAVRLLAHQLASLTDSKPDAGSSLENQAQLARALNTLLQK